LPVRPMDSLYMDLLQGVPDRLETDVTYSNTIIDMLIANVRIAGNDEGTLTTCAIANCVEAALQRYPFTERERAQVSWQRDGDFTFLGSELLMVHILFNLLKNALRHIGRAGKGQITIRLENNAKEGNRLIFLDTGPGVAPEVLPHIFKRFYSAPDGDNNLLGSGIGLAFCRDVMQDFGGTIRCSSVLGEFTQFTLTFPRVAQDSVHNSAVPFSRQGSMHRR
jgi:signal transduction histidine kinase